MGVLSSKPKGKKSPLLLLYIVAQPCKSDNMATNMVGTLQKIVLEGRSKDALTTYKTIQ